MKQNFDQYSEEDHEVWGILYNRQKDNLKGKACKQYLDCLDAIAPAMDEQGVPDFRNVDTQLMSTTGWTIEVVKGLIPVEEFFPLLADRRFCSSTWLRSRAQLDYLEEPEVITALQRLYWFTIEFGLMRGDDAPFIYGAGVLSSFGETNHIYEAEIEVIDYDIEKVIRNHFVNSEIQMRYYLIDDFEQLYHSLDNMEHLIARGLDIEPDIVR